MASKYVMAEGTKLEMSKEEVKDTTGNSVEGRPVTLVQLADTTKTIGYSGETTDEVDVTTLGSQGFKEFALGMSDPGEFSFTGHYVPKDPAQKEIVKAADDKKPRLFKVTFPDGTTFEVVGFIKTKKWGLDDIGGVITRDVSVRLSGKPKETVSG